MLPFRCCHPSGVATRCHPSGAATLRVLPPFGCCHPSGAAILQLLPLFGCCCPLGAATFRCCHSSGCCYPRVMLPIGCCRPLGAAALWVLLPFGCCCPLGAVALWVLLPIGCCSKGAGCCPLGAFFFSFMLVIIGLPTSGPHSPIVAPTRFVLPLLGCCSPMNCYTLNVRRASLSSLAGEETASLAWHGTGLA